MIKNIYETKSINKLILTFSLPAILSLIIEIMTSIVDTIFAGFLGEQSITALTAMGIISPILSIYIAFQTLYANSTAILVAHNLNKKNIRNEYLIVGILSTLTLTLIISIVSFIIIDKILYLLGAKEYIFIFAKKYLKIQLFSNIFSSLGYILTNCIRAFGYPKIEFIFITLSVIINIIFNFILVFIFDIGFIGLALGTLISEIFCMTISIIWLINKKLFPKFYKIELKTFYSKSSELFLIGFAQTIIQILSSCTGFFINKNLIYYTDVTYIGIWNIVQKIYTLLLMPIIGITQSIQTILSYYNGNNQEYKKQKTIKTTIIYTIIYGIIISILIFSINNKFNNFLYSETLVILKIVFSTFSVIGIFYTILTLFEVTGYEKKAVILIIIRQIFLLLPLIYLVPTIFPNFKYAIFLSIPISDIIILIITLILKNKKV